MKANEPRRESAPNPEPPTPDAIPAEAIDEATRAIRAITTQPKQEVDDE